METEQDTLTTMPNRLHPKQGEVIDRSTTIRFTFDGAEYTAHPGDTVASALTAAGVQVLSRSLSIIVRVGCSVVLDIVPTAWCRSEMNRTYVPVPDPSKRGWRCERRTFGPRSIEICFP